MAHVPELSALATCFALGTDGEDEDDVRFGNVAIQGHIAAGTATDEQLAELARHGPPDQRTVRQDLNGGDDLLNTSGRFGSLVRLQVLEDSVTIDLDLDVDSEFNPRQGEREPG